jgi:hypothetical protein
VNHKIIREEVVSQQSYTDLVIVGKTSVAVDQFPNITSRESRTIAAAATKNRAGRVNEIEGNTRSTDIDANALI